MKDKFLLSINTHSSNKLGSLSFFEANKDISFELKRIYYIYDVPKGTKRGKHAHKRLKQILWCPYGIIEVLLDNGHEKRTYMLDSPDKALLVPEGYWHDMIWYKDNSVLCVAASDYYDENDYIRSYSDFKKYVDKGCWKYED
jgi:dTDP-4-dehydrorhamnose 3,5-epimerase-like enzyme